MEDKNIDNFFRKAQFLTSAAAPEHFPEDVGFEIAFAGRSNAGKSSALNSITFQRNLARTSKTPGRTQLINFFSLDEERRLVDLPGYGYAKVPEAMKRNWQQLMEGYLSERDCLRGLILMVDSRHPLKEFDLQMLEWCQASELPAHVLLTKADKLSKSVAGSALQKLRSLLRKEYPVASAQLFSALKGTGIGDAHVVLNRWLERDGDDKGVTSEG